MSEKTKKKKNSYFRLVQPRLKDITEMSEKQMTEREMSDLLGIGYSTFTLYKTKYPEIQEAIDKGKSKIVGRLRSRLEEVALGYSYTIPSVMKTKVVTRDSEGKIIEEHEELLHYDRTIVKDPDREAIKILLKQLDRKSITGESFSDNDEFTEELKSEEIKLKKEKDDYEGF